MLFSVGELENNGNTCYFMLQWVSWYILDK